MSEPDHERILREEGLTPNRGIDWRTEAPKQTEKLEALDAAAEHPTGRRRHPKGLITRTAKQRPPTFGCEAFLPDGRIVVPARRLTPAQVRGLIDAVCDESGLPPCEYTMAKAPAGKADEHAEWWRTVRAQVAYVVHAHGIPAATLAAAIGISPGAASKLIARGKATGISADLPAETPGVVVKYPPF